MNAAPQRRGVTPPDERGAPKFELPPQMQRAMDARQEKLRLRTEKKEQEKAAAVAQSRERRSNPVRTTERPAPAKQVTRAKITERVTNTDRGASRRPESKPEVKSKPQSKLKSAPKPRGECVSEIDRIKERREARRKAAKVTQPTMIDCCH